MNITIEDRTQPLILSGHGPVITGKALPKHLQIAWGRHIFRLLHGGRDCGLFLRDLPLDLVALGREFGCVTAMGAYYLECVRAKKNPYFN